MANTIGRETAIVAPLFTKFTAERDAMHSTNLFVVADADYARDLKAKFLADAIPAESFAAGANALLVWGESRNYNFQSEALRGWPKLDDDDNPVWEHSDFKNYSVNGVSFRYYLNPNPLDRNLEWDMKTNLCPNPGSLGQLQP